MPKTEKGKAAPPKTEPQVPLDQVFSALEDRVEKLAARVADLSAENRRLREGLEESQAGRDRLKAELSESLERLGADTEARGKLERLEEERDSIRGRIERLIKNLEEAEPAPD